MRLLTQFNNLFFDREGWEEQSKYQFKFDRSGLEWTKNQDWITIVIKDI